MYTMLHIAINDQTNFSFLDLVTKDSCSLSYLTDWITAALSGTDNTYFLAINYTLKLVAVMIVVEWVQHDITSQSDL